MQTYTYRIHLEPEPEGGFTVTVPALPGCVTWGKDYEEALAMAQDAINCHLASLVKDGLPIPTEARIIISPFTRICPHLTLTAIFRCLQIFSKINNQRYGSGLPA